MGVKAISSVSTGANSKAMMVLVVLLRSWIPFVKTVEEDFV